MEMGEKKLKFTWKCDTVVEGTYRSDMFAET